jgi:hypothetical protein
MSKATKKTWALASSLHSVAGVCELAYQLVASIFCILFLRLLRTAWFQSRGARFIIRNPSCFVKRFGSSFGAISLLFSPVLSGSFQELYFPDAL